MTLGNSTWKKDSFGIFVVFIDFIVVVIILIYISMLSRKQKEFIKVFKDETMQMDDFSIRIKNLPLDGEFENREDILKAHLWTHLENILNQGDICDTPGHQKHHEIIDITFGKQKFKDTQRLMKLMYIKKKV